MMDALLVDWKVLMKVEPMVELMASLQADNWAVLWVCFVVDLRVA